MKIVDYPLSNGQWYAEKQPKKYIIWHGTQGRTQHTPSNGSPGHATSSIDGWNESPDHIGTPFLVDRDGTIYRTFKDEREWIYHLGLLGTNGRYDKASIGIEFANELELIPSDGKYYAFDRISKNTEYTGPVLKRTWRSHDWWAKLDEAQVDAAIELTLDLCNKHGIPKTFYYPSTTYDFPHCFEVAGILCHANCRQDKTDMILEDWVWAKLQAAGFQLVGGNNALPASPAVTLATPAATPHPIGTAKVQSPDGVLSVRNGPKGSATKQRELKNGDIVSIFARTGAWCRITADAEEWVSGDYLVLADTTAGVTPTAAPEKEKVLDESVTIFKLKDRPGYFFQGRMTVDADGAPKCYHPTSKLGLDDLVNSTPNSRKYIQGENGIGPAEGFYVSQTSLQSGADNRCDSFVDAETIPYMVFYGKRKELPGVQMGDIGMIVSIVTGKRTHAIIADGNNNTKGEASMKVASNLGLNSNPRIGGDEHFNYIYLIFPGTKFDPVEPAPHWPDDKIHEIAEAKFTEWGGMAMLRKCFPHIPA